MKQALNPYLPSYEYIPDGEPHVFGDRLYIFGSHDKFNGLMFCLNDYVCWSCPINDLGNWTCHGVIFKRSQEPKGYPGLFNGLYAPDVAVGPDGKYYLYYFLSQQGFIGVAKADKPEGPYEYVGHVKYSDGVELVKRGEPLQFDPGVFVDDDGKIYMYTGFGPKGMPSIMLGFHKPTENGPMMFELEKDMITIKNGPSYIGVKGIYNGKGTDYEGHEFYEASSMRKFDGKYYFIYSTMKSHELAYAVSDNLVNGFKYGGLLIDNGDLGFNGNTERKNYTGNVHGSIVDILGNKYVFYHRQTNKHWFSRQGCAEKLRFEDGKFYQSEMTSCGLNNGPLQGKGEFGSYIACNLYSKEGACDYLPFKFLTSGKHPYFTQKGKDRENNPNQYIKNMRDGATAVFKYFDLDIKELSLKINGKGGGKMCIYIDDDLVTSINIEKGKGERVISTYVNVTKQNAAIKMKYVGESNIDFISFTLK